MTADDKAEKKRRDRGEVKKDNVEKQRNIISYVKPRENADEEQRDNNNSSGLYI